MFRHAKKSLSEEPVDKRHKNPGRPLSTSTRDRRAIKRHIAILRETEGSFVSTTLQHSVGLTTQTTNSTFRRHLHRMGYKLRRTRRKGVLLPRDLVARRKFCRTILKKNLPPTYWTVAITMYLGVGFEYKSNPYDHARSLGANEWRLTSEGLSFRCTSKGEKEGKKYAKFMVAISHHVGVVMAEPLTQKMSGAYFASIVTEKFPEVLAATGKTGCRVL